MAEKLDKEKAVVPTLYSMCLEKAASPYTMHNMLLNKDFRELPDHILFDFYHFLFKQKRLCPLLGEWSNLDIFLRMLSIKHHRTNLLIIFQTLVDHCATILHEIVQGFLNMCKDTRSYDKKMLLKGLDIGCFLNEGAWFKEAYTVLNATVDCVKNWSCEDRMEKNLLLLDCYQKRLYVEASYALFSEASETIRDSFCIVKEIESNASLAPVLATVFANYAYLYIMRCEYEEAFKWALKGIRLLNDSQPIRTCIFVLRIAAKACVLKRKYLQANFLIQQAMHMAQKLYLQDKHPIYADTLMVYAFFLLNYDNVRQGVAVYESALEIRRNAFGKNNILVALTYEELAYAYYVYEYNSGLFHKATEYVDKATRILEKLLPWDHLWLSDTKRIKGLIWEEIALDMSDPILYKRQQDYFLNAELLHKAALNLSLQTFGEQNLQTAKHYGNMGRLYQSMGRLEEAEKMQLLAIKIKEQVMGPDDFEVGLSAGHLASLYNFHMKRPTEAVSYHQKAIAIGIKLFGDSYSGLEYDYRGLIKVFVETQRSDMANKYKSIMREWQEKRNSPPKLEQWKDLLSIEEIVSKFFLWNAENQVPASTSSVA